MKVTINTDTNPHTIEVHGKATLGELIAFLSQYYPDFTWRDVAIGDKSFMQAPIYQGQTWWNQQNTPLYNPRLGSTTGTNIIQTVGTTGNSHSAGTTYTSSVRDSKSAADLFDKADAIGSQKSQ